MLTAKRRERNPDENKPQKTRIQIKILQVPIVMLAEEKINATNLNDSRQTIYEQLTTSQT